MGPPLRHPHEPTAPVLYLAAVVLLCCAGRLVIRRTAWRHQVNGSKSIALGATMAAAASLDRSMAVGLQLTLGVVGPSRIRARGSSSRYKQCKNESLPMQLALPRAHMTCHALISPLAAVQKGSWIVTKAKRSGAADCGSAALGFQYRRITIAASQPCCIVRPA